MNDIFSRVRGKILFENADLYGSFFSDARSKTAEHNVYERSKVYLGSEKEKTQKTKKIKEN